MFTGQRIQECVLLIPVRDTAVEPSSNIALSLTSTDRAFDQADTAQLTIVDDDGKMGSQLTIVGDDSKMRSQRTIGGW